MILIIFSSIRSTRAFQLIFAWYGSRIIWAMFNKPRSNLWFLDLKNTMILIFAHILASLRSIVLPLMNTLRFSWQWKVHFLDKIVTKIPCLIIRMIRRSTKFMANVCILIGMKQPNIDISNIIASNPKIYQRFKFDSFSW